MSIQKDGRTTPKMKSNRTATKFNTARKQTHFLLKPRDGKMQRETVHIGLEGASERDGNLDGAVRVVTLT
jgi:hypothetical protein